MLIENFVLGPVQANCYVLIDENSGEAAVIDPGDCNFSLMKCLKDSKITKLKYVMLTHGHFDHIDGVGEIKKHFPTASVAIHKEDAACLNDDMLSLARSFGLRSKTDLIADIQLDDGDTLSLGENQIEVIHTPGHTKGGVTYKVDNYLFTGDTLFYLSVGRTDFYGGSFSVLNNSIKKLFALQGDFTVCSGHGEKTSLDYERKNNPYVEH